MDDRNNVVGQSRPNNSRNLLKLRLHEHRPFAGYRQSYRALRADGTGMAFTVRSRYRHDLRILGRGQREHRGRGSALRFQRPQSTTGQWGRGDRPRSACGEHCNPARRALQCIGRIPQRLSRGRPAETQGAFRVSNHLQLPTERTLALIRESYHRHSIRHLDRRLARSRNAFKSLGTARLHRSRSGGRGAEFLLRSLDHNGRRTAGRLDLKADSARRIRGLWRAQSLQVVGVGTLCCSCWILALYAARRQATSA